MKRRKKLLIFITMLTLAVTTIVGQVTVSAATAGVEHSVALDRKYKQYIADAKAAGLKVGVYFYSQATNVQEAQYEANFVMTNLNGEALDLPVVYDAECGYYTLNGKSYPGKLAKANLSKAAWTNVATAFCDTVQARGYSAMFYGSVSKILTSIDYRAIASKYQMWIARYNNHLIDTKYPYTGAYEIWQYADSGRVPGINANVDMDVMYTQASDGRFEGVGIVGENNNYTTRSPFTGKNISHGKEQTGRKIVYGMDVSYHQGTVDFKKAKAAGIEYAIIRIGYARLQQADSNPTNTPSSTPGSAANNTINNNTNNSSANNTVKPAASEYSTALGTMKLTRSTTIKASTSSSSKTVKKLSKNARVTAYGVKGSWIRVIYKQGSKQYKGYIIARYMDPVISAVNNLRKTGCTDTTVTLSWKKVSGATGYQIYRSNAKKGKYTRIGIVYGANNCSYTVKNLEKNMIYYYKVRAHKKIGNRYGFSSFKTCSGGTTAAAWTVKTKKTDRIRQYAGTSFKSLTKVSKNTSLKVIYRSRDYKNKVWYKVQYKKGRRTYTGFIPQASTRKL